MSRFPLVPLVLLVSLSALVACAPKPCTVHTASDGSVTLSCPDGTSATLRDGKDGKDGQNGATCTASANGDGSYTLTCPGSSPITIHDGASCTASANGDGSYTLTCPGSAPVTVHDGQPGQNGQDGQDAAPCSATSDGAGNVTITCPGSAPVTVHDGTNGQDGKSCTVATDAHGVVWITCPDGTAAAISAPVCGNGEVETGEVCDDGNQVGGGCSADCRVQQLANLGSSARISNVAVAGNTLYVLGIANNNASEEFVDSFTLGNETGTQLASNATLGGGLAATNDGVFFTQETPPALEHVAATGGAPSEVAVGAGGLFFDLVQVGDTLVYNAVDSTDPSNTGLFAVPVAGGQASKLSDQEVYNLETDGTTIFSVGNSNEIYAQTLQGNAAAIYQAQAGYHLEQLLAVNATDVFAVVDGSGSSTPPNYVEIPRSGDSAQVLAPVSVQSSEMAADASNLYVCDGSPTSLRVIRTSDGQAHSAGQDCSRYGVVRVIGPALYWSNGGLLFRGALGKL